MSDQQSIELLKRNDLAISFTPEAQALRSEALESAAMVVKVDSELSQNMAVEAQKSCVQLRKLVETARKAVKAPVLDAGQRIDKAAKEFIAEVEREELRLGKLAGDFQESLLAKARSEEAARNERLTELERTREQQLSKCETLEDREQVHSEFSQLTQALQTIEAPPKTDGQVVRKVWMFEVENPYLLASAHPSLVEITPKRREITEMLALGTTIKGIRAWQEVKSGVRIEKEKAIEV